MRHDIASPDVPTTFSPAARASLRFVFRFALAFALWLLLTGATLALTGRLSPVNGHFSAATPPLQSGTAAAVSWVTVLSPTASGAYWDVAVGDVNHDGRLDVAAALFTNFGLSAWLGDGAAHWSASMAGLPVTGAYRGLELADVNLDGHLDLLAAGPGVGLWRGNGAGGWAAATGPATSGSFSDVAVGDWSIDGWPDVVAARLSNGGISAWRSNGAGGWTTGATGLPTSGTWQSVALCDFDSDGKLDIAAAGEAGPAVYRGNGAGAWTAASTGLPTTGSYPGVACGDLDGDGDPELIAASASIGVRLWTRDSAGSWTPSGVGLPKSGAYQKVAPADVDNDGRLDVLAGLSSGGLRAWTSGAGLAFTDASAGLPASGGYAGLAPGDLDDDGRLDLFAASSSGLGVQVWSNRSTRLSWLGWSEGGSPGSGTAWSDVITVPGGLAAVSSFSSTVTVWTGTGVTWTLGRGLDYGMAGLVSLASADLNHDGLWDLVFGGDKDGIRASWQYPSYWSSRSAGLPVTGTYQVLALGDINLDGQVDLAATGPGLGIGVWLGSAEGNWTSRSGGLPSSGDYWDLAIADMTNDAVPELIASSQGGQGIRLWRWYAPMSNWSACSQMGMGNYYGLDVGDINDDGKPDIAAARSGTQGVDMYLGDGACGVITSTTPFTSPVAMYARDVSLGDVNRDGKLDLAAVGVDPVLHLARLSFWFGDGGRTWSPASPTSAAVDATGAMLCPLNKDGLLDLLVLTQAGAIWPWLAGDWAPPGLWSSFSPSGWVTSTQVPTCTIAVRDTQSGLDVSTAQYAFSRDGGSTWSDWLPAACSGADGTTSTQQVTAPTVSFKHDSGTDNLIKYRLCDLAGNCGQSPDGLVHIDTLPPASGLAPKSGSHSPGDWNNDTTVEMSWDKGVDQVSGVAGYYVVWKRKPAAPTGPPVVNTTLTSTVSTPLSDATDWWFFVQPVDAAGHWGTEPDSLGPFMIDTVPPDVPILSNTDPPTGTWSNRWTVTVGWQPAVVISGSPVATWEYGWNHSPTTMPYPPRITMQPMAFGDGLDDAPDWYFHVLARDGAGNRSSKILHVGPFYMDHTAPTNPNSMSSSSHTTGVWSGDNTVSVSWTGATDGSGPTGVVGYGYSWSPQSDSTPVCHIETAGTNVTSSPLGDGNQWFHLVTIDRAGNCSTKAVHLGPFAIDTAPPVPWLRVSGAGGTSFDIAWGADDAGAGLATAGTYDLQYRIDGGDWWPLLTGTTVTASTWTSVEQYKTYSFRARAKDSLWHWSDWTAPVTGTFTYVAVVDPQGRAQAGVEVWRNDHLAGTTDASGRLYLDLVAGHRLAARQWIQTVGTAKAGHDWPFSQDWAYRVYITSVPIQADGTPLLFVVPAAATTVTLQVSSDNALIAFNLVASTEWDATDDELAQIEAILREASRYLYDATDGQMLIASVRLFDNAQAWEDADARFYTDRYKRAYADDYGIILLEGWQIHLGRLDDGPTLIHEWGHYALNLGDEYRNAAYEETGKCTALIGTQVAELAASVMDKQWLVTEFCSTLAADPHLRDTYQHTRHGESCWDTIVDEYADSARRWRLWKPTDYGQVRAGPAALAVDGWLSTAIVRADTGVCAPRDIIFTLANGKPVADPDVWLYPASGAAPMFEGNGDNQGRLTVTGFHNGDMVQAQTLDGDVFSTVYLYCLPGGAAEAAPTEPATVAAAAPSFRVSVGAQPIAGEHALLLWSRASAPLAVSPLVRVWQYGLPAFTLRLVYSPTLDVFMARADLDPERPMVGMVQVWARNAQGELAYLSSEFRVLGIDASEDREISSLDGRARLFLPAGSLERDSAVSIMPGAFLGQPPDLVPLSRPYHFGVDPASPELSGSAVVTLYYSPLRLSQVVSGTLGLYRWDPSTETWDAAGGRQRSDLEFITGRITRLGTYAILGQAQPGAQVVYLPVLLRQ